MKKTINTRITLLVSALLLNIALVTQAAYIVESWTGTDVEGWDNSAAPGTGEWNLTNPGSGGDTGGLNDGYLRIEIPDVGFPPAEQLDTVYTTNPDFIGDRSENLGISFSFYAETHVPTASTLLFQSDAGGTLDTWYWAFDYGVADIGNWINYNSFLSYDPLNWSSDLGGGSADFYEDITGIDLLGIQFSRNLDVETSQFFGIDNFTMTVPEPGTVVTLLTALLSCGFVLSRRFREHKLSQIA